MINKKALKMAIVDLSKILGMVVIVSCILAVYAFVIGQFLSINPLLSLVALAVPIGAFLLVLLYNANKAHVESCDALENLKKLRDEANERLTNRKL